MKVVLKTKALFTEQLRHLLTLSNGRMALDKLQSLYVSEFGSLSCKTIAKFVKKNKLPYFSFHVVNLSSLKWAVWAPHGNPIPLHRRGMRKMEKRTRSRETSTSMPTLCTVDDPVPGSISFDVISKEASGIIDRIESHLDSTYDTILPLHVPSASVTPTLVNPLNPKSAATLEPKSTIFDSTYSGADTVGNSADLPAKMEATEPRQDKGDCSNDDSAVLSTAYDFLKDDPVLLAELSKKPQGSMPAVLDTSSFFINDLTLDVPALKGTQDMTDGDRVSVHDGALSPAVTGASDGDDVWVSVPSISKPSTDTSSCSDSVFASSSRQLLPVNGEPVDFLQKNLDPYQVLEHMQKLEVSEGILTPDQMDPFLDYFRELSSRDLEVLEAKSNLKKKSGNGEVRKKKRNMAIRFPSQSKATPEELPTVSCSDMGVPVSKLPLANLGLSSSDESNRRGSPTKTLNHEDFIKGGNVTRVPEFLGDGKGEDDLPHPLMNGPLDSETGSDNFSYSDAAISELDTFL